MPVQINSETTFGYSRRALLKNAFIGAAAITATTVAAGGRLIRGDRKTELPGPGSIFEPRHKDLARHWLSKLDRLRLR
jgi:hypothetical protein